MVCNQSKNKLFLFLALCQCVIVILNKTDTAFSYIIYNCHVCSQFIKLLEDWIRCPLSWWFLKECLRLFFAFFHENIKERCRPFCHQILQFQLFRFTCQLYTPRVSANAGRCRFCTIFSLIDADTLSYKRAI